MRHRCSECSGWDHDSCAARCSHQVFGSASNANGDWAVADVPPAQHQGSDLGATPSCSVVTSNGGGRAGSVAQAPLAYVSTGLQKSRTVEALGAWDGICNWNPPDSGTKCVCWPGWPCLRCAVVPPAGQRWPSHEVRARHGSSVCMNRMCLRGRRAWACVLAARLSSSQLLACSTGLVRPVVGG
jgi:hypothetical protein